jgi:DNA invertase Pin-like site-specific DNA recombinase
VSATWNVRCGGTKKMSNAATLASSLDMHYVQPYRRSRTDRPGIRRLVDVRAGNVDIVLVYKLDRLSRRLRDLTEILDLVAEHGAR